MAICPDHRVSPPTTGSSPTPCRPEYLARWRPNGQVPYGDLAATDELLTRYDGQIACLILEAATQHDPPAGYLAGLRDLAHRHGCVLIFDEMITGFRWSEAGAQGVYGVTPDLSTFGKALGNGFAVSAWPAGANLMERGGLHDPHERVFLLSTTHGAETHALAAAIAVMETYVAEHIAVGSTNSERSCQPESARSPRRWASRTTSWSAAGPATWFRHARRGASALPGVPNLFLRQLLLGGVIAPSFVVSGAMTEEDIDRTVDTSREPARCTARHSIRETQAVDGRTAVKPVFRRFV